MKYLGRAVDERTTVIQRRICVQNLWSDWEKAVKDAWVAWTDTRRVLCLVNVSRQPEGQVDRSSDLPDVRPHVLQLATLLPPPPSDFGSPAKALQSLVRTSLAILVLWEIPLINWEEAPSYTKCTYTWTYVATGPNLPLPHTNRYIVTRIYTQSRAIAQCVCFGLSLFDLTICA